MKTKKPTTKKAPAKPKLKEGQYSHIFLTRWIPSEGEILERLVKQLYQKSYNPTVIKVFKDHERLLKELEETKKELRHCQDQLKERSTLLKALKNNFKILLEDNSPAEDLFARRIGTCTACGEELFPDGECPEGCEQD